MPRNIETLISECDDQHHPLAAGFGHMNALKKTAEPPSIAESGRLYVSTVCGSPYGLPAARAAASALL
jgi:hypothetical protein